MKEFSDVFEVAKAVLDANDRGHHTVPSAGIYPHQWFWDSCFISIGLRHYDIDRAKLEIRSLLRGQWNNGMIPNIVEESNSFGRKATDFWQSWRSPLAPDDVATSGITQPPMLAEAVIQIGASLKKAERRTWYKTMLPGLIAHHYWLYNERNPYHDGLTIQIHPWETGLDNSPPWMNAMQIEAMPLWIKILRGAHIHPLLNVFRQDTHYVPAEQRLSTLDGLMLYSAQRRIRRHAYDIQKIVKKPLFTAQDLTFNCILIRANEHLKSIADAIDEPVPSELLALMDTTAASLEQLWDPYSKQYYSRRMPGKKTMKLSSIATLMPLYAGSISKERAKTLVGHLHNKDLFGANYPVPSVPLNNEWFKPTGYWQGPTWLNTNWLIIDGLTRYGFTKEADIIRRKSLKLIEDHGCYEYFSPLDGSPAGAKDFSWTAALAIDMLKG